MTAQKILFSNPTPSCDGTSAANVTTPCVSSIIKLPSSVDGQVCSWILHGGLLLVGTHEDYMATPSFCGHLCTWLQHMRTILIYEISCKKVLKSSFKAHLLCCGESNETHEMFDKGTFISSSWIFLTINRKQMSTGVKEYKWCYCPPPPFMTINTPFLVFLGYSESSQGHMMNPSTWKYALLAKQLHPGVLYGVCLILI